MWVSQHRTLPYLLGDRTPQADCKLGARAAESAHLEASAREMHDIGPRNRPRAVKRAVSSISLLSEYEAEVQALVAKSHGASAPQLLQVLCGGLDEASRREADL